MAQPKPDTVPAARVIRRREDFKGWRRLETVTLQPRSLKQEGWAPEMDREIYYIGDVACTLLYCAETDEILLNQQFRSGAFLHGIRQPFMYECCVGLVDEGESPAEAARREAVEETGSAVLDLEPMGSYYPSPSAIAEEFHYFVGRIENPRAGVFGLEHEGEEIRTHLFPAAEVARMIETNEIQNGMMAFLILRFLQKKNALRKKWGYA